MAVKIKKSDRNNYVRGNYFLIISFKCFLK